jgi:hypothetical protein
MERRTAGIHCMAHPWNEVMGISSIQCLLTFFSFHSSSSLCSLIAVLSCYVVRDSDGKFWLSEVDGNEMKELHASQCTSTV